MKVDVLLGLQWGDEGKGKVVDFLAPRYDVVARFQGGPNAGHTLEFDNVKHVLHQIPSGIFHPEILNVIGNGVVLDPIVLKREIESLGAYSIDVVRNLYISKKAQLILPTHRMLDEALEKAKGENKIGSTLKGIGPTYQDKIGRHGLRVGDVVSNQFKERYDTLVKIHKQLLDYYNYEADLEKAEKEFFKAIDFLKYFKLVDSEYVVNEASHEGKQILAEGAQGSLLDIDFGSYPFVTSSNTTAAGACTGLGIAPRKIGDVYGIFKAYCTRVGSGPFPTELNDETGEKMRDAGHEYGATTGRPRRCGWLDLPALKYAVMINGVTQLFMMKADVLSQFDEIKVCTHYKMANGDVVDKVPYEIIDGTLEPVYTSFSGWHQDISGMRHFEELPEALADYIEFIENSLHIPINIVSVGPDRVQTLIRNLMIA